MKPYLMALLAFLLGALGGYSLKSAPVASPPPGQEPSTVRERESRASTLTVSSDVESLAELAASVDLDLPPMQGRITGSITLPGGEPLANVRVTASPRGTRLPKAEDHDFDSYVRRTAEIHLWASALRRQALTGADGSYLLEELGDVEYRVKPALKGYRFKTVRGSQNVTPDSELRFVATALEQVRVSVTLPDGRAPNVAVLLAVGGGSKRELVWSPGEPVLDLEAGRFTLQAQVADRYQSELLRVEVPVTGTIHLPLRERPGIAGTVTFPGSEIIERAFVVWAPGSADASRDRLGKNRQYVAVSTRRPRYSIQDLPPGVYSLGVVRRLDETPVHVLEVDVSNRVESADLELEAMDRAQVMVVRVVDERTREVPIASYALTVKQGVERAATRSILAVRKSDGSDWLKLPALARAVLMGDVSGNCQLAVRVRGLGEKLVELERRHLAGETEVRFRAPSTLLLTVTGTDRVGPLSAELFATGAVRQRGSTLVRVQPSGEAHLGPVQPGKTRLRLVTRSLTSPRGLTLFEGEYELEPGDNAVSVRIPDLHELTVSVADSSAMALVLRSSAGEVLQQSRILAGTCHFVSLPAGEYGLELMGKRGTIGQMVVYVPSAGTVEFTSQLNIRLRVEITDEQGELARAGFVNGDYILGVDGRAFRTQEEATDLLDGVGASVKLLIERAGSEQELEVVPNLLRAPSGGKIRPVN